MMQPNFNDFIERITEFAVDFSTSFSLRHATYPMVSILNGKKGTNALKNLFGSQQIENLWKTFFCISCNINEATECVHRQGPLWLWLRASSAVPGLVPPITNDGKIHVDGGVINNLPLDTMKSLFDGQGRIIAVDLSIGIDKNAGYHFPPIITYWDAFLVKSGLNPKHYKFPYFAETLLRSLMSGATKRRWGNLSLADILIKPDLSGYGTLIKTERAAELITLGYQQMQEKMEILKDKLK